MEIERKFLVKQLPNGGNIDIYPHKDFSQGYICTDPVLRIRRESEDYVFTCKGRGMMVREELNLPLDETTFATLSKKIEGRLVEKTRYFIPLREESDESSFKDLVAELDVFRGDLAPLLLVEVEFSSEEEALCFTPPAWFGEEVTHDPSYFNNQLALRQ